MNTGYIKLWRKITDSFIWKDSEALKLWIYLLMTANFKETEFMFLGKKHLLKRGQILTGYRRIAAETGISLSKVFRLIKMLKNETLIETEDISISSLITITKYDQYQSSETEIETPVKHQWNTSETPVKQSKECNNVNNVKEGNNIYVDFEQSTKDKWNLFCNKYPLLSKVEFISESRRKSLKRRYTEPRFKDFEAILAAIEEQPFLINGNKDSPEHKNWRVSFDWLIKNDTNYLKILERKYKGEVESDWRSLVFRNR